MSRDFSFDSQARRFDGRAGLPAAASSEVAAVAFSRLEFSPGRRRGDLLLDLGAGTGEVGAELYRRLPAGALYLALDLSPGMLRVFGDKVGKGGLPPVARLARAVADLSRRWPVENGAAAAIFCSRAAHRLDSAVFLAEARRVLRPGGLVLFGALERSRDSVRAALQRRLRRLLAEELGEDAPAGRDRRLRHEKLAAELGGGCEVVVAASFEVCERAADSLAAWRSKRGLAGLELPASTQDAVLARLEAWARERYGDLNAPRTAIERYQLLIARRGQAEEKL